MVNCYGSYPRLDFGSEASAVTHATLLSCLGLLSTALSSAADRFTVSKLNCSNQLGFQLPGLSSLHCSKWNTLLPELDLQDIVFALLKVHVYRLKKNGKESNDGSITARRPRFNLCSDMGRIFKDVGQNRHSVLYPNHSHLVLHAFQRHLQLWLEIVPCPPAWRWTCGTARLPPSSKFVSDVSLWMFSRWLGSLWRLGARLLQVVIKSLDGPAELPMTSGDRVLKGTGDAAHSKLHCLIFGRSSSQYYKPRDKKMPAMTYHDHGITIA